MSKKLTLILALVIVGGICLPAFAEVQNVKVSGDITVYGIYRDEYDLDSRKGDGSESEYDDNAFYASIARVRIDADLTDNVGATIRLLNERVWDVEDSCSDDTSMNLDLAYITLKEFLYCPLTLTIGRQNLKFGSGLVVGDPDTNAAVGSTALDGTIAEDLSARKAFDAIRATLDYSPFTIDLILAKINEVDQTGSTNNGVEDEDLYGVNVAYNVGQYNSVVEGYLFVKDADTESTDTTLTGLSPSGDIYTLGLRGGLEPVKGLTLTGEVAYQFGKAREAGGTERKQRAWALDLDGGYVWDNEYTPGIGLGYSYRSGQDPAVTTGKYKAWNPMYEDQTQGIIADYILAGVNNGVTSNASIIKAYGSVKPIKDVTLSANYYNYRLVKALVSADDSSYDGYTDSGTTLGTVYMNKSKALGDEIDLGLTYNYTEDVSFGLTAGWFFPGKALKGKDGNGEKANDDTATSIIGSVKVVF
ncbi:MAG: alginate export family protein [Candidatus Omnitrophica bacterium]|nr:alginate export family protein [Candidatus Omnitrophota bacterium]